MGSKRGIKWRGGSYKDSVRARESEGEEVSGKEGEEGMGYR